jgi:uncharacterized protein YoxC
MVADVTREEFGARVGVLEQEVEGEKLVTRHILEQSRRNADDLAAVKTRLDRVERKVDEVAQDVSGLKAAVDRLMQELPNVVGAAMRGVLRKRGGKSP